MEVYPTLFNVGDCVKKRTSSEMGWIVGRTGDSAINLLLDIRYNLDNRIERNVSLRDIIVVP